MDYLPKNVVLQNELHSLLGKAHRENHDFIERAAYIIFYDAKHWIFSSKSFSFFFVGVSYSAPGRYCNLMSVY